MTQSDITLDLDDLLVIREDNKESGVVTLTLNQPKQFNALSVEVLSAMQAELDSIAPDNTIRVVVIQATGKAFCAGHNLKQMRTHTDAAFHRALFQ